MRIAPGISMLTLEMNVLGRRSEIHPALLYDDQHAVLVDVGMPGQLDAIRAAMAAEGVPFERLDGVILTHQDIDHIGAIREVLGAASRPVTVYAHAEDRPYIEGKRPLIKWSEERLVKVLEQVPEPMRDRMRTFFQNPPSAEVTHVVEDGEVLPIAGGVQVIFTPGHTPGHISLYHLPSKTLIAGDATTCQDGRILGPSPQATEDMARATASHRRFADLDVAQVICYHGGLCANDVASQLQAWGGASG